MAQGEKTNSYHNIPEDMLAIWKIHRAQLMSDKERLFKKLSKSQTDAEQWVLGNCEFARLCPFSSYVDAKTNKLLLPEKSADNHMFLAYLRGKVKPTAAPLHPEGSFMVLQNSPDRSAAWNDLKQAGHAAMGPAGNHVFLLPGEKWLDSSRPDLLCLNASMFVPNYTTFRFLHELKESAASYAKRVWGKNCTYVLFFHLFDECSMLTTHAHLVRTDRENELGPAFYLKTYREMPVDVVEAHLKARFAHQVVHCPSKELVFVESSALISFVESDNHHPDTALWWVGDENKDQGNLSIFQQEIPPYAHRQFVTGHTFSFVCKALQADSTEEEQDNFMNKCAHFPKVTFLVYGDSVYIKIAKLIEMLGSIGHIRVITFAKQ